MIRAVICSMVSTPAVAGGWLVISQFLTHDPPTTAGGTDKFINSTITSRRCCSNINFSGSLRQTQHSMRLLIVIPGLALILIILWDAFETIILPRRVTRRFRRHPTELSGSAPNPG